MECDVRSLNTSIDGRCSRSKTSSSEQSFQKSTSKLCNQQDQCARTCVCVGPGPIITSPVSVPGHAVESDASQNGDVHGSNICITMNSSRLYSRTPALVTSS